MTMLVNIISFIMCAAIVTVILFAVYTIHSVVIVDRIPPNWMIVAVVFCFDIFLLCAFLSWFVGKM